MTTKQRLENELEDLFSQQKSIDDKIVKTRKKLENIKSEEVEKQIKDNGGITPELIMQPGLWKGISHTLYERLTKWVWHNYHNKGVIYDGSGADQLSLAVQFDKRRPFEHQLGLMDFYPYLIPVWKDSYNKNSKHFRIGVTESTLSQYGSYNIFKEVDSDIWRLVKIVYSSERSVFSSKDIKEVLRYVYDHHPMEY